MNKYEATIIFNTKGLTESADDLINAVERDFKQAKFSVEEINRIGRRQFSYTPQQFDGGYYATYKVSGNPADLKALQGRLKLNTAIHQHFFLRSK